MVVDAHLKLVFHQYTQYELLLCPFLINFFFFIIVECSHDAERLEQEAKGRLERQRITDEAEAERSRRDLLELQAQSAAVESSGQAKAEAQSRAEAAKIEGEAAVEQARLKAEASKIEAVSGVWW